MQRKIDLHNNGKITLKRIRWELHWQLRIGKYQCEHCSDRFRTKRQLNAHSVKHRNTAMSTRPRRVSTAMSSMTKKLETKKTTDFLRPYPLVSSYIYPVKRYGPKETNWEKRIRYIRKKQKRRF